MELRTRRLTCLLLVVVFALVALQYISGSLMIAVPNYDFTHIMVKPLFSSRKILTMRKNIDSIISKKQDTSRAENITSSVISQGQDSAHAVVNMTSSITTKEQYSSRANISMIPSIVSNEQDTNRADVNMTSSEISNGQDTTFANVNKTLSIISNNEDISHDKHMMPSFTTISDVNMTSLIISNDQDTAHVDVNTMPLHISKEQYVATRAEQIVMSSTIVNDLLSSNGILNTALCAESPPNLGPVKVDKSKIDMKEIEKRYPEVKPGGLYSPSHCTARHKVAIIVPYRDRYEHLKTFLNHMHPFLMKQYLDYGIYIIDQAGTKPFNRGKLMNVGFVESQKLKEGGWQCVILHDIDLLPLDTMNIYSCPKTPRHMSLAIDKWGYKDIYKGNFGGVSALTADQFKSVNGFSNMYWGWGGEDDDLSKRLIKKHFHISKYKLSIARYMTLKHKQSKPNPKRWALLKKTTNNMQNDGLSTLAYNVVNVTKYPLYTHVLVNIDKEKK